VATLNGAVALFGYGARLWEKQSVAFPLMVSFAVIQVSNRTPILGNYETFVIHGIPGATAL
jgi:hypothetical protein